jgi:membrane-associated phospholipid phosphatase
VTSAAFCGVGFAGIALAVAFGLTRDVDRALLALIQAPASFPLDLLSSLVTISGRLEVTGAAALLLAILWFREDGWVGLAPLILFLAVAVEAAFKYLVPHAPPPADALRDFNLLQVVRSEAPYAFPSGHVMRVTFLSVLLALRTTQLRTILAAYVAVVCVTRIYVGAHWPSDVLGGLLFGVFSALTAIDAAAFAPRVLGRVPR